jgi:hypothetical protein
MLPGPVIGFVELGVTLLEGVGLVGESGVGVDVRGDGDVGVAEGFLDGDQGDAGLDAQGRAGVPEIVKPDGSDSAALAYGLDVLGDVLGIERVPIDVVKT